MYARKYNEHVRCYLARQVNASYGVKYTIPFIEPKNVFAHIQGENFKNDLLFKNCQVSIPISKKNKTMFKFCNEV